MVGNIGQCLNKKGLSLWSHEQEKVQIRIFQSCKSLRFLPICLPGFIFFFFKSSGTFKILGQSMFYF